MKEFSRMHITADMIVILIIRGIYCHHLFVFILLLVITTIIIIPNIIEQSIICHNFRESAVAIVPRVAGLRRVRTQNCRVGLILNATLNLNASKDTVGQGTGLTCRLMHAVAELPVPFVSKVLPPTKSRLHRLSLIRNSDLPPSLQVLGEIQLDNTDEDVVSVIGSANRTSGATSPCLVIGVHAQK